MKETVKMVGNKIVLCINDGIRIRELNFGTLEGSTLVCRRDSQKHFFRSFNSYGFSKKVIVEILFSTIEIHLEDGNVLKTTKAFLLENGLLRDNEGEVQIHLPVPEYGMDKALAWAAAKRQFPQNYKSFPFLAKLAVSNNKINRKHI